MAFVSVSIFGLHLVQLPTFGHREHLIAFILTKPNITYINQILTYIDK